MANSPTLYILDIGMGSNVPDPALASVSGQVLTSAPDGSNLRTLVSNLPMPDGIDISPAAGKMFWTNMGRVPSANDGLVMSANLDGSDVGVIIPEGKVHTPKQLVVDHDNEKLYFCDREGMRVHRCDFDGGRHEVLVQTGDWTKGDQKDQTLWCVGITVDAKAGKFYWSQKGPSKGGKGRIFRAGMLMPEGQDAKTRSDIELLFDGLPEPIDLEIVSDSQMLYWTDRGEYPIGNTLNRAFVGPEGPGREKELGIGETQTGVVKLEHHERKMDLLARHFHEAIGLKIDDVAGHIYITDLGGSVYRFDMEGKDKKIILETDGAYTGIGLVY